MPFLDGVQEYGRLFTKEKIGEILPSLAERLSQIHSSMMASTRLKGASEDERAAVECSKCHAT